MRWIVACIVIILIVASLTGSYLYWGQSATLERKDVMDFRVVELQRAPSTIVRISGLSGHSAMSVKNIKSRVNGDAIDVDVLLFLARKGTSGSFQYDITVPENATRICFGKAREMIWQRGTER